MKIQKQFEIEMAVLSVYVPKSYVDTIDEVAKQEKVTKSEVFRKINGLITKGFNFDFSVHDKPLLNYTQSVSVLQYALLEFCYEQMVFHSSKNNKHKSEFYEYLYKTTKVQYDFYSTSLLNLLDEGFDALSDNLSEELAERVETLAYMLEKGTNDDWNKFNKIAKKVMKRDRKWKQ